MEKGIADFDKLPEKEREALLTKNNAIQKLIGVRFNTENKIAKSTIKITKFVVDLK